VRRRSFWAGVAAGLGVSAVLVTSTFLGHSSGRTLWGANTSQLRDRLRALGFPALRTEGTRLHTHQHLDLYVNGDHVTVPGGIGIGPHASFYSPLHTHDSSGIVHVESPLVQTFTLGQFFGVWGVRLTRRCIGGYCSAHLRTLEAFVDGKRSAGDPSHIVLRQHEEIVLAFGSAKQLPKSIRSSYSFPPGS
jgi:hypothetical protein